MPHVISQVFPSGTAARCEVAMRTMNGGLGRIPGGQIAPVAGPVPGGFQVIAIEQSQESRDRFMTEDLAPVMGRGAETSFTAPPTGPEFEATTFDR